MKEKFKESLKDKVVRLALISSFIIFVVTSLMVFIMYSRLNPYIPFLNSLPWGKERLVQSTAIFILPIFFLLVIILNTVLSISFYDKHILISRILSVNAFLFVFFGLLAFIQIILLTF